MNTLATIQSIFKYNQGIAIPPASYSASAISSLQATTSSINFNNIVCSQNGQYIYASSNVGLYYSTNTGSTWSKMTISGSTTNSISWVDCSLNGQYIWVIYSSYVLMSNNYGSSFSTIQSGHSCNMISCDGTGVYAIWVIYGYGVYRYNGSSVVLENSASNTGWLSCAMAKTNGPYTIINGNRKGGSATSNISVSTTPYNNTSLLSYTIVDNNSYDVNAFESSEDGNNMYLCQWGYTIGTYVFINGSTSATQITALNGIAMYGCTTQPSTNFVCFATVSGSNVVLYYSWNGTSSFNNFTLCSSSGVYLPRLCSYIVSSTEIVVLCITNLISSGSLSQYSITFIK
jgi:hypothetical protein